VAGARGGRFNKSTKKKQDLKKENCAIPLRLNKRDEMFNWGGKAGEAALLKWYLVQRGATKYLVPLAHHDDVNMMSTRHCTVDGWAF
jgi:hypothetical protein